jgi:hypothetical protein
MTNDDIIRMAWDACIIDLFNEAPEELERFAALVAAAEREALAEGAMQRLTDVQQEMERKPLSIETINKLWNDAVGWGDASSNEVTFVRAIERAHGIGGEE